MFSNLESTFLLLRRGYPDGVPPDEYYPLVYFLSKYLSDKNVAIVMEEFSPELVHMSALNDVYKARADEPNDSMVLNRLSKFGLKDWIDEEEC